MLFGGMRYYAFAGQTAGGRDLTVEECRVILALPVMLCEAKGVAVGDRDGLRDQRPDEM